MQTKTCPSCQEEVPSGAFRCKSCFHDFDEVTEKKASAFMTLLTLVSAMAVLASGVFYLSSQKPSEIVTRLSEENQAVIRMEMTASGLQIEHADFSDITRVEHSNDGSEYRVVVHTSSNAIEFQSGTYPLGDAAKDIYEVIKKTNQGVMLAGVEVSD